MEPADISEVVARAIKWHLAQARMTEKALGERAGVSPRTIGNFLRPDKRTPGSKGKVPSGKLYELALIASALGCSVEDLVSDLSDQQREERRRMALAAHVLKHGALPSEHPAGASRKQHPQAA